MQIIECPQSYTGTETSIFLAGGITGCRDWQAELIEYLKHDTMVAFNPRRAAFDIDDKTMTQRQIEWEHRYLKRADLISFWFEKDQIQPIALFELGRWSSSNKVIFVGCHPEYPRREDVIIQMGLERHELVVANSIGELATQIDKFRG